MTSGQSYASSSRSGGVNPFVLSGGTRRGAELPSSATAGPIATSSTAAGGSSRPNPFSTPAGDRSQGPARKERERSTLYVRL